ncbi:hypothetical protein [Paenibacillus arenilitoris]|uniref:Uncharacterized protein n=1 Tax=Paenibacillus arenilitoris TaxID=2772299 RepID=A0A927CKK7_9BACL|nr:hypothetical protein [Paenibacillus arenilitoris]MBD2868462.1 hypothetical protein [Paenibacillus arenilitoris]
MDLWKGAWYLAKHELAKDRWRSLFTFAFVLYMLLFSVPLFIDNWEGEASRRFAWATDFIYLSLLPCLGFIFNKTMASYWKNDAYTKKMAQWRTMPISSRQIALGRLIQMAAVLLASQLLFFLLQYVILRLSGVELSPVSFILYALFWFFYSITMATAYVYWEIGHTGKIYLIVNFIYIFLFLLVTTALTMFKSGNIIVNSLLAIEDGNWWIVLAALAAAVAAVFIGVNRMENRLEKRSYRG